MVWPRWMRRFGGGAPRTRPVETLAQQNSLERLRMDRIFSMGPTRDFASALFVGDRPVAPPPRAPQLPTAYGRAGRGRRAMAADVGRPGAVSGPGLVIFQFGADLFYANAGRFAEDVRGPVDGVATPVNWLVVDAGAITSVDYSAARVLRDLQQDLIRLGIALVLVHPESSLRADLDRHRLSDVIGADHILNTLHGALAAIRGQRVDVASAPIPWEATSTDEPRLPPAVDSLRARSGKHPSGAFRLWHRQAITRSV